MVAILHTVEAKDAIGDRSPSSTGGQLLVDPVDDEPEEPEEPDDELFDPLDPLEPLVELEVDAATFSLAGLLSEPPDSVLVSPLGLGADGPPPVSGLRLSVR